MLSQSSSYMKASRFLTSTSKPFLDTIRTASQAYREVWGVEPPESFVVLELARTLESQRRKELLLLDPYFREQTLLQTDDYWVRLTQSWTPPDWPTQETSPGDR
jgi:hypothetical protein